MSTKATIALLASTVCTWHEHDERPVPGNGSVVRGVHSVASTMAKATEATRIGAHGDGEDEKF